MQNRVHAVSGLITIAEPSAATAGRRSGNSEITQWVAANFKTVTAGGQTIYDLTAAG